MTEHDQLGQAAMATLAKKFREEYPSDHFVEGDPREKGTDMTAVPLQALRRLVAAAQDLARAPSPGSHTIGRLREAGKAFDEACTAVGFRGPTYEGKSLPNLTHRLAELVEVQGAPGNYDQSPYMLGLLNGLILAQSVVDGKEPQFVEALNSAGEALTGDSSPVEDEHGS